MVLSELLIIKSKENDLFLAHMNEKDLSFLDIEDYPNFYLVDKYNEDLKLMKYSD